MIVTRVGPAGEVQPAQPGAAVRPPESGGSPPPPPAPAQPRPLDEAAALRVLYEEVRAALAARLGSTFDEIVARAAAPDATPDRYELGRLVQALAQATGSLPGGPLRAPWGELAAAIEQGATRALEQLGRLPAAPATAGAVVGAAREEVLRAVESLALAAKAAPEPLRRAVPAALEGFRSALEERVGALPPQFAPPSDDPAEAVQALARGLRFVATDPGFVLRATPSVLEAALADGVQRAQRALALQPLPPAEAERLVADLRAVLAPALAGGEEPAPLPLATRAPPVPLPATPGQDPAPQAARTLARELAQAVAARTGLALPGIPPATDLRGLPALTGLVLAPVAALLAELPAGDARTAAAPLAADLQAAARRALLQLPAGAPLAPAPTVLVEDLALAVLRVLTAAESAAAQPGEARGFARLSAEAALALLRGYELPFRLDLAGPRRPGRRRGAQAGADVDGIESSDAEDTVADPGAALAEFVAEFDRRGR